MAVCAGALLQRAEWDVSMGDTRDDRAGRPATIYDVARVANVSIGTVSKALNDRGTLRPETRARVRAAAAQLDFRPNDLVHSLLRGRSFTVGLLSSDQYGRFSLPVMAGIEDAMGSARMSVFLCSARDDPARERQHLDSLLAKQVDGIIVTGRRVDARPPINIGAAHIPILYAFTQVDDPGALCMVPDDAQGGRLAAEQLIAAGRTRLAHITGPEDFEAVRLRAAGMRAAAQFHGIDLPPSRMRFDSWGEEWGYAAANLLLDDDPRIDGIFCGNDLLARGAADALRERGMGIPDDVALVGFDNWEIIAETTRPPLTTIDMNLHELGRLAGMRLLEMIDGRLETGIVRLPCSLVVRQSCGGRSSSPHLVSDSDHVHWTADALYTTPTRNTAPSLSEGPYIDRLSATAGKEVDTVVMD
jgi:LacI family transcriptional regulator